MGKRQVWRRHLFPIIMSKAKKMKCEVSLADKDIERNDIILPGVTFYKDMRFVIIFVQFFGLMPIHNVTRKNIDYIKFRWISLRTFYSLLNLTGSFVSGIFCIVKFAVAGLRLDKTGTMTFYILNSFATWQLIQISRKWSVIIKQWCFVEMSMKGYGFMPSLRGKFYVLTLLIMGLALVEHILFVANALVAGKQCEHFSDYSAEIYFGVAFPHIFTLVRFSYWKAALVEVVNILSTFTWNFTDLFIILNSSSLASKFKQINCRLERNKSPNDKFWQQSREDYNKLSRLCLVVDEHLSPLVLISFINNTYFICVQLYNSLKQRAGIVDTIYFNFSFGFLLARTTAVTLFAAKINDESKKPLRILYSLTTEKYSTEVSRYIYQVNACNLGLSGYRFFTITRSFLLKMAGTIVTFELMFLQFGPLMKSNEEFLNSTYICLK